MPGCEGCQACSVMSRSFQPSGGKHLFSSGTDLVISNLAERTRPVQGFVKPDDVRVLVFLHVSVGTTGKESKRVTDFVAEFIGGSVETEDDSFGLGGCRVGGHRGRAQVWGFGKGCHNALGL
jgi:hypothetical protein